VLTLVDAKRHKDYEAINDLLDGGPYGEYDVSKNHAFLQACVMPDIICSFSVFQTLALLLS
jgi:hypothetical protein